jgi:hypothetical protein
MRRVHYAELSVRAAPAIAAIRIAAMSLRAARFINLSCVQTFKHAASDERLHSEQAIDHGEERFAR